ncbi:MAG: Radical SAM domain protein [Candidatus Curtissbacteria bacterium GW2011_GWC2_38_9]|uniref:Radical SAM core domain-containing protein n=3 Tax=Candidatus Curtissiibacteriota TaxID=1752717 RepID=A0A1F5HQB1_9BACT|nr:MAG: Radical SAM domain protein [Candidatus Curtissbacteria bacterium GW2011_GWC2_38_9]KKS04517.1 MAG: Radical SAM domain protein [Candidatus Curtissbacteria bacterium GW2011_GWA2_41_24]OGD90417.1 MAG: hypothetical protein A2Z54_03150 [Candidatus Curtissbacteria bacterium RIFCSPHIGHO2_02_39_8]OGE06245.1 MAG: hypothetical protein A2W70_00200 [Candidatus Curtissbacteria bacterium RIFCSPLOWO2_02_41_11]
MAKAQTDIGLKNLYKIPWTKNNNPNGWIEPTTYCQLACPGCYRGLALPNPIRIHENLAKLKKEIDTLIKIRNIKILSIAGGEPLLYPKLNALISYATSRGLKTRLVTNGAALTIERLKELKKLGTTEVAIHVAQYQNRGNFESEEKLNLIRQRFCQLFRQVGGVELNFVMTVSKKNFHQLPKVINFYKKNSDIVSRVVFTLFKDIFFKQKNGEDSINYITLSRLAKLIGKLYRAEPCAYLGKKFSKKEPGWLFFAPIILGEKTVGFADAKTAEKLHHQNNNGSWNSFPAGEKKWSLLQTLSIMSLSCATKTVIGYISSLLKNPKSFLKTPKCQIIVIFNTPNLTKHGWDICESCPDAMLYNEKLVPSCLLERVKLGEKIEI